jgi:hypothetical protein
MRDTTLVVVALTRNRELKTLNHATVIRHEIFKVLSHPNGTVVLDFDQAKRISDTFLITLFGGLYWSFTPEELRAKVRPKNMNKEALARLAELLPIAQAGVESTRLMLTELEAFDYGGLLRLDPIPVEDFEYPSAEIERPTLEHLAGANRQMFVREGESVLRLYKGVTPKSPKQHKLL